MRTPWVRGIQAACDDPEAEMVVNMKASQTAYTDGVVVNDMMYRIDNEPSGMIAMFAKRESAEDFVEEKLGPAVRATPRMKGLIDMETTRKAGVKKLYKKFVGGFLKLGGSNSTGLVKSTSAPVIYVEEPDDANTNIKGQGDSIKLLIDRSKTFEYRKIIYGGTPTVKDLSAIEDAYKASDQRKYYVPCHDCGESHVLDWVNVKWQEDADINHEIYGRARLDTAVYVCPKCGSIWDDKQKFANVQAAETTEGAGWIAHAEFHGTAGFGYVSELYVPFRASRMSNLLKRYLEARHKFKQGDDTDYITWVNTSEGKPYEYENNNLDSEALEKKAEIYREMEAPTGALKITIGIDVQHDRFAIIIRAWGRGDESWLIYWGEIFGIITDKQDPVWDELERLIFKTPVNSADGYQIHPSAASMDTSDGGTSDQVYAWIRAMKKKYNRTKIIPVKGASDERGEKEIFTPTGRAVDHRTPTKASKYGLRIFMVGTNKAKDLLSSRLQLEGAGPGRMHFYKDVRKDYFDQITAEVKAPSRRFRGRKIWQKKSGARNEALDCEVYALHASRHEKIHLLTPGQWDDIEHQLKQEDLFTPQIPAQQQTKPQPSAATGTHDNIESSDPWL